MSAAAPTPGHSRPAPRLQARPAQPTASSSRPVAARPTVPRPAAPKPATSSSSTTTKASKASTSSATPSASNAAFLVPGKDTSSSAGKVFAKPSKEWVLPERAKPGRKVAVEEPDSSRQSQNRQSQRAHRARRTDYITTLEERIRQFENDEIHSNVRLQEVARALKADNERLKAELLARSSIERDLKPKAWEEERGMLFAEIRGLREEVRRLQSQARMVNGGGGPMGMRDRAGSMSVTPHPPSPRLMAQPPPLAPIINGIRHIADCPICPDPDPDCPCQKTAASTSTYLVPTRRSHQPDPTISLGSTIDLRSSPPPITTSCGFCQSTEECLCRMIDEEEDVKPIIISPPTEMMGLDDGCGLCADGGFCACAVARNSPSVSQRSLQIPFPQQASAVAVPLRKGRSSGDVPTRKSIWALDSGVVTSTSTLGMAPSRKEAVCSGDPRNCDACRDDTFGQEFCSNFFQSRDPTHSCTNCKGTCSSSTAPSSLLPPPSHTHTHTHNASPAQPADLHPFDDTSSSGPLLMACCGNPGLCGHQSGGCTGDVIGIGGLIPGLPEDEIAHETIRVDQAWKTLKAHPNAKFASLAFLADVVAQRAGPHMSGTTAAEAPMSPISAPGGMSPAPKSGLVHSGSVVRDEARPEMGAEGRRDGKRKVVVESSAVRDALRLLDGTPAPSEDGNEGRGGKRARLA